MGSLSAVAGSHVYLDRNIIIYAVEGAAVARPLFPRGPKDTGLRVSRPLTPASLVSELLDQLLAHWNASIPRAPLRRRSAVWVAER